MTTWQRVHVAVTALAVMVVLTSPIAYAACGDGAPSGNDPDEHARQILARHRDELLAVPGVVGVGLGRDASTGAPVLRVYTAALSAESKAMIPRDLEGVPVEVFESGEPRPR